MTDVLLEMWDKLSAYEDTGLEPEEITAMKNAMMGKTIAEIKEFDGVPISRLQELAEAEKDGRLVVLPCAENFVESDGTSEEAEAALEKEDHNG